MHCTWDSKKAHKLWYKANNEEPKVPCKLWLGNEQPPQNHCSSCVENQAVNAKPVERKNHEVHSTKAKKIKT